MNDETFTLLRRSILNWQWYQDANTLRLFIHCILKANWKDAKFKGEIIKRGSFVTSLDKISVELGLSIQQTKTALRHLIECGSVTNKSGNKYRIITVLNYDEYQTPNRKLTTSQQTDVDTNNKQSTNNQQSTNKQLTTIEEIKEQKEEKESLYIHNNSPVSPFPDIEKLLDEREAMDNENLFDVFEREFARTISQCELERLHDMINEHSDKLVRYALREALTYDKKSFDYIDAILRDWKQRSFTAEQYEEGER